MKKIFIYYSETGNGDLVAKIMMIHGYEVLKIEPKHHLPKVLFLRMMVGGFQAGRRHKAKLLSLKKDLSSYEEVVIGSPIWNGKISCPINTVLASWELDAHSLRFILYSGGGKALKASTELIKKYPGTHIYNLKEPKKNEQSIETILFSNK